MRRCPQRTQTGWLRDQYLLPPCSMGGGYTANQFFGDPILWGETRVEDGAWAPLRIVKEGGNIAPLPNVALAKCSVPQLNVAGCLALGQAKAYSLWGERNDIFLSLSLSFSLSPSS